MFEERSDRERGERSEDLQARFARNTDKDQGSRITRTLTKGRRDTLNLDTPPQQKYCWMGDESALLDEREEMMDAKKHLVEAKRG
eukprot:scaffold5177_cov130-Isochrysis_galbana.AAC.1